METPKTLKLFGGKSEKTTLRYGYRQPLFQRGPKEEKDILRATRKPES